jgi:hypothetical protein
MERNTKGKPPMKTRVAANHCDEVRVRIEQPGNFFGHWIAVRFRPDQRKQAKFYLIRQAFLAGWVIPFDHYSFNLIDRLTWEA